MSLLDKCDLQIPINIDNYKLKSQILFLIISNNQTEKLNFSNEQIFNLLKKTHLEIHLNNNLYDNNFLSILIFHLKNYEIDFTKEQFSSLFENISTNYMQNSLYHFLHNKKFFYQDAYCQKIIYSMLDNLQLPGLEKEISNAYNFSKIISMNSQELFIHLQHLSLNQQLQSSTISSKTRKI